MSRVGWVPPDVQLAFQALTESGGRKLRPPASCSSSGVRCWPRNAFTNGSLGLNPYSGDYVRGRSSNASVALIAMGIRCFHGQVEMEKWRSQWGLYWVKVAKVPVWGLCPFVDLIIPHFIKQRSLTSLEPIANTLKITSTYLFFP